jgi:hypothetical protein
MANLEQVFRGGIDLNTAPVVAMHLTEELGVAEWLYHEVPSQFNLQFLILQIGDFLEDASPRWEGTLKFLLATLVAKAILEEGGTFSKLGEESSWMKLGEQYIRVFLPKDTLETIIREREYYYYYM